MYLGIHVSSAGGVQNSIKNGEKFGVNSIQIMPTAPMRWATKLIEEESIQAFVDELEKSNIKKILLHGIYLTNLAREDKKLYHLGKMGLVVYLDFSERVANEIEKRNLDAEILGVCFHPGSEKELGYDESLERISKGINWVLNEVPGKQKLLIETTAGTGKNLGRSFEELKKMRDGVEDKKRVGFVLDTQHTYAAGYDWVNDMDGVIEKLDKTLGLENIKSIHLNDSMMKLSSNKDRHANLGEGELGEETIRKLLHREELKDIPFILETPALKSDSSTGKEVERFMELAS
jgi:deoxyribonuclease-4